VVAALFFSPRSARCAISLLRASGLAGGLARADALAISPRVAAVLAAAAPEPRWRGLRVAARPDQDSLLRLLGPGPGTKDGGFRQAP
jgi:uroporphyrinogen-III synthase